MTIAARIRNGEGAVEGTHAAGGGQADAPSPVSFTMPTPPSVNEIYKNVRGRGRVKTKVYDDFVMMGITAIRRQRVEHVQGCVVAVFGVERMSGQADIDNRLKAMLDTIVKAGVIEDDRFVTGIACSWLPKANGLAHVRIIPVQKLDLTFQPSPSGVTGGWYCKTPQLEEGEDHGDFAL